MKKLELRKSYALPDAVECTLLHSRLDEQIEMIVTDPPPRLIVDANLRNKYFEDGLQQSDVTKLAKLRGVFGLSIVRDFHELDFLESLSSLQYLSIGSLVDAETIPQRVIDLSNMLALRTLRLPAQYCDGDVYNLPRGETLKNLCLSKTKLTHGTVADYIGSLTSLRTLDLFKLSFEKLDWLANLPKLAGLEFYGVSSRTPADLSHNPNLSVVELQAIKSLNSVLTPGENGSLETLHIESCGRVDLDAWLAPNLNSLEFLCLRNLRKPVQPLRRALHMPRLQHLSLDGFNALTRPDISGPKAKPDLASTSELLHRQIALR